MHTVVLFWYSLIALLCQISPACAVQVLEKRISTRNVIHVPTGFSFALLYSQICISIAGWEEMGVCSKWHSMCWEELTLRWEWTCGKLGLKKPGLGCLSYRGRMGDLVWKSQRDPGSNKEFPFLVKTSYWKCFVLPWYFGCLKRMYFTNQLS